MLIIILRSSLKYPRNKQNNETPQLGSTLDPRDEVKKSRRKFCFSWEVIAPQSFED
jgi:hypothetical protein